MTATYPRAGNASGSGRQPLPLTAAANRRRHARVAGPILSLPRCAAYQPATGQEPQP